MVTKASAPRAAACQAFFTGKSSDAVTPVTWARPALSTAMLFAASQPLPPRNVEYSKRDPLASSLVTNASPRPFPGKARQLADPPKLFWKALGVVGNAALAAPVK